MPFDWFGANDDPKNASGSSDEPDRLATVSDGRSPVKGDLLLPVYLNQRVVFDLMAMLQGGIARVTRVTQTEQDKQSGEGELEGSFGLSDALSSLLEVGISGTTRGQIEQGQERVRDETRVHTPASLTYTLRRELVERELLQRFDASDPPEPGDIIELSSHLRRNPVIRVLQEYRGVMELPIMFEDVPVQSGQDATSDEEAKQAKALINMVDEFLQKLKAGGTVDIVTDELSDGYKAVVTLEEQFLNDPTMADLVDGYFTVLGKVVERIDTPDDSISLMRKTALTMIQEKQLRRAFAELEEGGDDFEVPSVEWKVEGPVVQVLPIAIYS